MITSEQEYLTFILDGEEFGVDILCVQEIRVLSSVTELPNKPDYIKGVINLRGIIIPIVDLRIRFGKTPLAYDDQTVMVILKARKQDHEMVVGVIVDAVSEVYKFSEQDIRKAPSFGNAIDACFLKGLANFENKLVILLDTNTLLDENSLYQVDTPLKNKPNLEVASEELM